jgi:hypothetical protein
LVTFYPEAWYFLLLYRLHQVSVQTRVVDRYRFDADPDPTFHFDADPDPDLYPTSSYQQVGKS